MHEPRAGRRAWLCDHKEHGDTPVRKFQRLGEPEPTCNKHGKMKRQRNAPYMGQEVPE